MVTFRFHLLSLTAVFLALAVGIAIGATVVDEATVDTLQGRLDTVEENVAATRKENAELQAELSEWRRFSEQAGDELVEARLVGHPVLLVGVHGADEAPLDRFRQSLSRAGAQVTGTVWFTSKVNMAKAEDVTALAQILGVPSNRPDELRQAMIGRLASSWSGSGEANPLPELIRAAFAEFEPPEGLNVNPATIPRLQSKFVVMSDVQADVPNELLAIPLALELGEAFEASVLAIEGDGAGFVSPLRQRDGAELLSSVDNVADFRGRMAGVLAMQDLVRAKKLGHYGVGPRASRLVPAPAS